MQLRRLSIVPALMSALLLAACGSEAPAPNAGGADAPRDAASEQLVAGPERRILAFGDSLFAGYNVPHPLEKKIEVKIQTREGFTPA